MIREPFIDKIPNLRAMLYGLSKRDCNIDLITTEDRQYPAPSFLNENISHHTVSANKRFSTLRLLFKGIIRCYQDKPDCIIGCSSIGLLPAYLISKLFHLLQEVCYSPFY